MTEFAPEAGTSLVARATLSSVVGASASWAATGGAKMDFVIDERPCGAP